MRITCPACAAQFSLDAAIQVDSARGALMRALAMPAPLGALLAQYLGLFRPKMRALSMDRADKLLGELLSMIEAESVTRNGVTRPATVAVWAQALESMIDLRNQAKLTLPLKTHGYLLEVVFAAADKLDAKAERETEQARQRGEHRNPEASQRFDRALQLSRIRGDFSMQLIERGEAIRRLKEIGYGEDALNG